MAHKELIIAEIHPDIPILKSVLSFHQRVLLLLRGIRKESWSARRVGTRCFGSILSWCSRGERASGRSLLVIALTRIRSVHRRTRSRGISWRLDGVEERRDEKPFDTQDQGRWDRGVRQMPRVKSRSPKHATAVLFWAERQARVDFRRGASPPGGDNTALLGTLGNDSLRYRHSMSTGH